MFVRAIKALSTAAMLAALCACSTVPTITPPHAPQADAFVAPTVQKVVLVILENKHAAQASRPEYPFLHRLATEGASLANYHGVAHPSQPNYVALVSGSFDGISGDTARVVDRPHLGELLSQKQLTWKAYAEGHPGGCDLRVTIPDGRYASKHVPFTSFRRFREDASGCAAHLAGFPDFLRDARAGSLPNFSLVVPNLDHDAHDQPLEVADRWLAEQFGPLLDDPAFRRDVILVVTFDENDTHWPYRETQGNHVYASVWGGAVRQGAVVDSAYDHYDLLRTIEALFGLAPMAEGDRHARPITGIWR